LTFAILGFGNWYTGVDKTSEYEGLLKTRIQPASNDSFEDFPGLTADINSALLRPLHRSGGTFSTVTGKLDFYRLVRTGGEMMMLVGLFITAAASIHQAYRRRAGSAQP